MHLSTQSLLPVGLSVFVIEHCAVSASFAGWLAAARSLSSQIATVVAATDKALPASLHRGPLHPYSSSATL